MSRRPTASRSPTRWLAMALVFGGALASRKAMAQVGGDDVPRQRTIPAREQLEAEIESSRYHLGPFFIHPVFQIRALGYDNNVFGVPEVGARAVSDWTGDIFGGVRLLQRLGSRMYIRAEALPEYTWYLHLSQRRALGGYYGASWIGVFNKVSFDANGSTNRSTAILSADTLALTSESLRVASAGAEVEVGGPLAVFARAGTQERRYFTDAETPAEIQNASDLNRREDVGRVGLRLRVRRNLDVSALVEQTRVRFEAAARAAAGDNESTGYLVGLGYSAPRFFLHLSGGYRKGHGVSGSTFPDYSTTTGSYFASYFILKRLEIQAYGFRGTSYGLTSENPYFFSTSNGGGVNLGIGQRLTLRGYGEFGINDFPVPVVLPGGGSVVRKDKTASYGGGFTYAFLKQASLTALASEVKLDSNVPGQSRTVTRITTTINLSGDFSR
ncbi:MAG: hypothetical protein ABI592_00275 [Acidobacteriota bacterium]